MLEFDRAVAAIDLGHEGLSMLGLIVGYPPYFGAQHREIVGNDEIELPGRPILIAIAVRHFKKMNELVAAV
jgi:hypothetical protein